jgi:pantoate--beta-alanine ligase
MTVIESVDELRGWRESAGRVYFVPTMGALHQGHATLVREARKLAVETGRVAVSIFVNPLQFGPNEDFDRYPRTLDADLAACEEAGADVVFAPSAREVYEPDRSISVNEGSLSKLLCGRSRPGHFDGVCTVVAKLFNLMQPNEAIFGKKDYQQLAIIRRMVRDLNFPVTVHGMETVREADGLAMSSRNRYLAAAERAQASGLYGALRLARDAWLGGVTESPHLLALINQHLAENASLGRKDYVEIVNRHTLQPLEVVEDDGLIALAVFFEKARLIDNVELVCDSKQLPK